MSVGKDRLERERRRAAEKLRSQVLRFEDPRRRRYARATARELRGYRGRIRRDRLVARCAAADIVFVGDFHAWTPAQRYAGELLEDLVDAGARPMLGVEFLYTRQQHVLDRFMAGSLAEDAFLERVHYEAEWGYPWEGFGGLLRRARRLGVPVRALDVPPRGGDGALSRRDRHAAGQIVARLRASPRRPLVVLFGESHLASHHLPARVERLWDGPRRLRAVRIFQDPDDLYWQLVERYGKPPEALHVSRSTYAVFHGSPLEKYEAYRGVLERWGGEPGTEEDYTAAVHHVIQVLLEWIGVDPRRRRVELDGGWSEPLEDTFPEVYSGSAAEEMLEAILAEHGRRRPERQEARRRLASDEALYEPLANAVFLRRYRSWRAAAVAAAYVRAALTGRLFRPPPAPFSSVVARTFGAAYNESLSALAALVLDPASTVLAYERAGSDTDGRRELMDWLPLLRSLGPAELLAHGDLRRRLARSHRRRKALARAIGWVVGRRVYDQLRSDGWTRRDARQWFTRSWDETALVATLLPYLRRETAR